jgi:hypothetical protein
MVFHLRSSFGPTPGYHHPPVNYLELAAGFSQSANAGNTLVF